MTLKGRRLSLLTQFMLLSAAIFIVGGGFVGWWMDRRIIEVATNDSIGMASVFVDGTVAPHIDELQSLKDLTPVQEAHLLQLMSNNVGSGRNVAINLWTVDGGLAYSTLAGLQSDGSEAADITAALQGQVVSRTTDRISGLGATQLPGRDGAHYQVSYLAVRSPTTHEPLAVVSFYQDFDDLRRSFLYVRLQTWLVLGTATVLMFLILSSVVRQASNTIDQQREALDRSRRQIQQAAVRAAELNEASMRRLGADLHDGPAQDLSIGLMRMEPLRAAVEAHGASRGQAPMDFEAASFDLNLIETALQSSLQEIRNIASGLRLPELSALDVAQSIRRAATDYMRKTGREAVLVEGPQAVPGNGALKSAAYRIVQEALNNGHLHVAPSRQSVRFAVQNGYLDLVVADDGCGFRLQQQPGEPGVRRRLGLAGLQERVEILDGRFEVRSAPGEGTVVHASLPLNHADPAALGEAAAASGTELS